MRSGRLIAALGVVAALAIGVWSLRPGSGIGGPAPELTFRTTDGRQIALRGLKGRPVLVSFWSVSCRPCIEEMPWLSRLYRGLAPRGLEIIGVAMPYDRPDEVLDAARRHALPYPIALDPGGELARAFGGITATPTSLLIDPSGAIRWRTMGPLEGARVERQISEML